MRSVFPEYSLSLLNLDSCFRAVSKGLQELLGSQVVTNKCEPIKMPRSGIITRRFQAQPRQFLRLRNDAIVWPVNEVSALGNLVFIEFQFVDANIRRD